MIKILGQKHRDAKPSNDTMMFYGPFSEVNEIIFDGINAGLVTNCAIRTKRMDLQDWMPISGVKSYVIQPLATHQTISVTL